MAQQWRTLQNADAGLTPWVEKILKGGHITHSSILAGENPMDTELVGYSPWVTASDTDSGQLSTLSTRDHLLLQSVLVRCSVTGSWTHSLWSRAFLKTLAQVFIMSPAWDNLTAVVYCVKLKLKGFCLTLPLWPCKTSLWFWFRDQFWGMVPLPAPTKLHQPPHSPPPPRTKKYSITSWVSTIQLNSVTKYSTWDNIISQKLWAQSCKSASTPAIWGQLPAPCYFLAINA